MIQPYVDVFREGDHVEYSIHGLSEIQVCILKTALQDFHQELTDTIEIITPDLPLMQSDQVDTLFNLLEMDHHASRLKKLLQRFFKK